MKAVLLKGGRQLARGAVAFWAAFFLVALGSCRGEAARTVTAGADAAPDLPVAGPGDGARGGRRPWRSPAVRWCASGGAPIVGLPVVDAQGLSYVATSDGYLHAFERDGRYRWSYTVKGTPRGSVSLRPGDGAILLGTSARYIYAIHPSGTLHWAFRTVTPVWSGLFALNPGSVVFLGLDERLYAVSPTGRARYRVRAPGTPSLDPVVAPHDVVWVGLGDGVARFVAAYRLEKFPLPSSVEQIITVGDAAVARAGGRAYFIEEGAAPRDLGPAQFLVAGGDQWAIVDKEQLRFPGQARPPIALSRTPSAPPAWADGRLWVPFEDGTLLMTQLGERAGGASSVTVTVADQALMTPVLVQGEARALVATLGGEFCGVELESFAGSSRK